MMTCNKSFHNTEELIKQIETKSAIERKKHETLKDPGTKAKERQEELNRKRICILNQKLRRN